MLLELYGYLWIAMKATDYICITNYIMTTEMKQIKKAKAAFKRVLIDEFGIKSKEQFLSIKGEDMAVIYENIKILQENFNLTGEEVDEIIEMIFEKKGVHLKKNMASDFHSVIKNGFEYLYNKHGFKDVKRMKLSDRVTLMKHLEGMHYCYVIVKRHSYNNTIETLMYVGVLEYPDDGLDSLSANIKIQVGHDSESNKRFFEECAEKIGRLLEPTRLNLLIAESDKELQCPSSHLERHKIYTLYELPFYKKVVEKADNNKKILKDQKLCKAIIADIYANLDNEAKSFFYKMKLDWTIKDIWDLCYISTL